MCHVLSCRHFALTPFDVFLILIAVQKSGGTRKYGNMVVHPSSHELLHFVEKPGKRALLLHGQNLTYGVVSLLQMGSEPCSNLTWD
jgi:hypothetical protein